MARRIAVLLILVLCGTVNGASLEKIADADIPALAQSADVVVLNFWATWCAPCREEIPSLNKLHEQFPGVQFIGINLDDPENAGAIPGFLKKNPIAYRVLLRAGKDFQKTASVVDSNWTGGIPATFVYAHSKLVFSKIGKLEEAELHAVLASH